ncbi:H-NS family nucleoid-associated regulatory protein [Paraburkholderia caledonica]|jgi:DNA-binding protein H-NS
MSELKNLRLELARVSDLLADARAREVAAALARFKEEVELLNITEQEVRIGLGYDKKKVRAPAKYYDPQTGKKWSGKGKRPKWLIGKRLEDYDVDAPRAQPWWPGEEQSTRHPEPVRRPGRRAA